MHRKTLQAVAFIFYKSVVICFVHTLSLPLFPPPSSFASTLPWSYEVVWILLREPSLDCLHAICHHIVCLNP